MIVGVDGETGGLTDCDERNGAERTYAAKSPLKGKRRLNSKVSILSLIHCSILTLLLEPGQG